ncbi:MAG: Crp/Fnr family transcriptional regulator [Ignavibacteria bacterium]
MNLSCSDCENLKCFVLSLLTLKQQTEANNSKKILSFQKGKTLFKKGNTPKGIYILLEGSLEAILDKKTRFKISNGEITGFASVLFEEKYNYSVRVLNKSYLCFFEKTYFIDLFLKNKAFADKFVVYIIKNNFDKTINKKIKNYGKAKSNN